MHFVHAALGFGYVFSSSLAMVILASEDAPAWEPVEGFPGVKTYYPIIGNFNNYCT